MGKLGLSPRQFWCRLMKVKAKQAKLRWELLQNQIRVNRLIFGPGFGVEDPVDEPSDRTVFDACQDDAGSDELLELASDEVASIASHELD